MSIENATLTPTSVERPDLDASETTLLSSGLLLSDKYRLDSPLGRGSMGEVWLATHERLRTQVAIKFLSLGGGENQEALASVTERFEFEAQISARLSSATRHVVAVHDVSSYAGLPYLVMEYVKGYTLESVVERQAVEPGFVANVLDQVADALTIAHRLGIVHRDIKPSNLMISETESGGLLVKVADFGVAKAVSRNSLAVPLPKETGHGVFVGSPMYMSPEQLRADGSLDWRSDMWSLAVVAYEALTRAAPFNGKSMMHMMVAISDTAHPPPSTIVPTLPPALDAWFDRALAKDPAARFESLGEMVATFRAALPSELLAPRRSGFPASLRAPRRFNGLKIAGAAAAIGLVGVLAFMLLDHSHAAADASPAPSLAAPRQDATGLATSTQSDPPPTSAIASSAAPAPSISADARSAPTIHAPTPSAAHSSAPAISPPPSHHKEIDPSEIH